MLSDSLVHETCFVDFNHTSYHNLEISRYKRLLILDAGAPRSRSVNHKTRWNVKRQIRIKAHCQLFQCDKEKLSGFLMTLALTYTRSYNTGIVGLCLWLFAVSVVFVVGRGSVILWLCNDSRSRTRRPLSPLLFSGQKSRSKNRRNHTGQILYCMQAAVYANEFNPITSRPDGLPTLNPRSVQASRVLNAAHVSKEATHICLYLTCIRWRKETEYFHFIELKS